jgi:hypothetical protein
LAFAEDPFAALGAGGAPGIAQGLGIGPGAPAMPWAKAPAIARDIVASHSGSAAIDAI